ncbi:hypothetical protein ACFL2T_02310 [Elusimicrobiota bacterium]
MGLRTNEQERLLLLFKEGVLLCAGSLDRMSTIRWDVILSGAEFSPPDGIPSGGPGFDAPHVAVHFATDAHAPFAVSALFSKESARLIAEKSMFLPPRGGLAGTDREILRQAISEVSNILAQRIAATIADDYNAMILLCVPELIEGDNKGILAQLRKEHAENADLALASKVELHSGGLSAEFRFLLWIRSGVMRSIIDDAPSRP